MPNFLVFGAAKSGTTSIYKYLEQHPDVFMSSFKEPGFFAFEGETPTLNGPGAQKWVDKWVVTDLESYQKLFTDYNGEKAIGEASPYYIYYPKSAATIYKHVPNIKLIAILRNPVDRAFSNYVWAVRDRAESITDFQDALAAEENRIKENWGPKWHYKNQGFYYRQLKPYYELFKKEQIKIYLYENFVKQPVAVMQDIFDFLEIDDSFVPDMSRKHNTSRIPKNKFWHQFLDKPNPFKSIIKPLLPLDFRQNLKQNAKEKNLFKPTITSGIRQQLIAEYREDISKLQDLIGQDLSKWLV
ncbi:MAG: sulfotransferase [Xenococcaceae cyanobacterium]